MGAGRLGRRLTGRLKQSAATADAALWASSAAASHNVPICAGAGKDNARAPARLNGKNVVDNASINNGGREGRLGRVGRVRRVKFETQVQLPRS